MSFELLDFVNNLITEETLDLPAKTLVAETAPEKQPSTERISRYQSITERLIARNQALRLAEAQARFANYRRSESLYQRALNALPHSIDDIFSQIVDVVASGKDTLPSSWTMAHREEATGKDHDEELKKIWVRMYMLGFLTNENKDSN